MSVLEHKNSAPDEAVKQGISDADPDNSDQFMPVTQLSLGIISQLSSSLALVIVY